MMIIQKIWRDPIFRGSFWLSTLNIGGSFFSYLVHPLLARRLSISQYGDFQAVFAVLLIFWSIGSIFYTAAARQVAKFGQDKFSLVAAMWRQLWFKIFLIGLFFSLLFFIFAFEVADLFNISQINLLMIGGLSFLLMFPLYLRRGIIAGLKKFRILAINIFLENFFRFLIVLFLVWYFNLGLIGAAISLAGTGLLSLIYSFRNLSFKNIEKVIIDLKFFWRYCLAVGTFLVIGQLFFYLDILAVKYYFSAHEAGIYSAMLTVGRMVFFISQAVPLAMFPMLAELGVNEQKKKNKTLIKAFLISLAISLPVALLMTFWPTEVIKLFLGQQFLEAAIYLPYFAVVVIILNIFSLFSSYHLAVGNYWVTLFYFLILLLEISLFVIYHQNFYQIITIVAISYSLATLASLIMFLKKSAKILF